MKKIGKFPLVPSAIFVSLLITSILVKIVKNASNDHGDSLKYYVITIMVSFIIYLGVIKLVQKLISKK